LTKQKGCFFPNLAQFLLSLSLSVLFPALFLRFLLFGSKMGKPRKGWREKDASDHWNNQTDDQCKRFFKVLIGDFRKRLVSNFLLR